MERNSVAQPSIHVWLCQLQVVLGRRTEFQLPINFPRHAKGLVMGQESGKVCSLLSENNMGLKVRHADTTKKKIKERKAASMKIEIGSIHMYLMVPRPYSYVGSTIRTR
jgi:hypothetical protein